MEVAVNGSVDQALFVLKRKLIRAGFWPAWRRHVAAESPGERRRHKRALHMARTARSEKRQQIAEARRS